MHHVEKLGYFVFEKVRRVFSVSVPHEVESLQTMTVLFHALDFLWTFSFDDCLLMHLVSDPKDPVASILIYVYVIYICVDDSALHI